VSSVSEQGNTASSCEQGKIAQDSIKGGKYLEELSNCQVLRENRNFLCLLNFIRKRKCQFLRSLKC
jgi:hypothetical protein